MSGDHLGLEEEYKSKLPIYSALVDEVKFILNDQISQRNIKIHDVEGRVKSLDSINIKCDSKDIRQDHFDKIEDVAGIRVICLFRSDVSKLESIVRKNFKVLSDDNKIYDSDSTFGYMSHHFICRLPTKFTGPRYDKIRSLKFEIQIRTLCMHAWAVISHYVDYKDQWDAPRDLRKSFNALSGLFYVADTEFEQFYAARISAMAATSKESTKKLISDSAIDLDSLAAYISRTFPNRESADSSELSRFVKELRQSGYKSISELDKDITRAATAFDAYEADRRKTDTASPYAGKPFAAIGAARLSLGISSKKYRDVKYGDDEDFDEFEHLLEE